MYDDALKVLLYTINMCRKKHQCRVPSTTSTTFLNVTIILILIHYFLSQILNSLIQYDTFKMSIYVSFGRKKKPEIHIYIPLE